ncbi:uncharacterized protein N7483_004031 [Penicillium malachiteum]|uniref:uncharacterized protein n=1 Tax=Penicillium malachiteum TaxID=1324776 RepID=UPI002547AED2|nr:uncharacterized protein N7483_004031 [Penicillium malachiteum]KAJ5729523.1 hypothetical protein N7483_004031 [Penicillium malachiteum]
MDSQRSVPNDMGEALENPPHYIAEFYKFCDDIKNCASMAPKSGVPTEYLLSIVSYAKRVVDCLIDKNAAASYGTRENSTILSKVKIFGYNFVDDSPDFDFDYDDSMSTDESANGDSDYEVDQEELNSLKIKVNEKMNLEWNDILSNDDESPGAQNPLPNTVSQPSHHAALNTSQSAEVTNMEKPKNPVEQVGIKSEPDTATNEQSSVPEARESSISIPATTFTIRWRNSASPFKLWHKVYIGSIPMGSRTRFLSRVMTCIRTAILAIHNPMLDSLAITALDVNAGTGDVRVHTRSQLDRNLLLQTSSSWLPYVDRGHLAQVWSSQSSEEVQHIDEAQPQNTDQSHGAPRVLAPAIEFDL